MRKIRDIFLPHPLQRPHAWLADCEVNVKSTEKGENAFYLFLKINFFTQSHSHTPSPPSHADISLGILIIFLLNENEFESQNSNCCLIYRESCMYAMDRLASCLQFNCNFDSFIFPFNDLLIIKNWIRIFRLKDRCSPQTASQFPPENWLSEHTSATDVCERGTNETYFSF